MAKNDYTRALVETLFQHRDALQALHYLVENTPDDDDHYHLISLIDTSLSESFSRLESAALKAGTDPSDA